MIEQGLPGKDVVVSAIEATFTRRGTHEISKSLEIPPGTLAGTYADMAQDCGVEKKTMEEAFLFLAEYWGKLAIRQDQ